jgi:hypothetical protein
MLTNVDMTDLQVADLDCDSGTAGNQTTGFTIAVGGSITCNASDAIKQAEIDGARATRPGPFDSLFANPGRAVTTAAGSSLIRPRRCCAVLLSRLEVGSGVV